MDFDLERWRNDAGRLRSEGGTTEGRRRDHGGTNERRRGVEERRRRARGELKKERDERQKKQCKSMLSMRKSAYTTGNAYWRWWYSTGYERYN